MSRSTIQAAIDAVAIFRAKERLSALVGMTQIFTKDPDMLSRRTYEIMRPALYFLANNKKPDGAGVELMDYERHLALRTLLRLQRILRARLKGGQDIGEPFEGEEKPVSPAAEKKFDPWDLIKLPSEEEKDEGI